MKKSLGPVGFQLFAIGLAGVSIFLFFATMSPYAKALARLDILQPKIRATVAAQRFLRYSSLEIKEAIDYGLVPESDDREAELQKNADDLARWRSEAQRAFDDLALTLQAEAQKGTTEHLEDHLALTSRIEDAHARLGSVEHRLRDIAMDSSSRGQVSAVLREQLIPLSTSLSSIANQLVQKEVADMQAGIFRLSGNLDGIVLYSGAELRARAESMNASASKEVLAGVFGRLFTQSLQNFSEFLLTGSEASAKRIGRIDQEMLVIQQWRVKVEKDQEPGRSTALKRLQGLEQHAVEFHASADRIVNLAMQERKARAMDFAQRSEPLVYSPVLRDLDELAVAEEQRLSADSQFIRLRLERTMWLTGGLLIVVLIAAVGSPILLSRICLEAVRESERKRAETQLRASEERFRALAETATAAIVSADAQGTIIYFNQGAASTFGYSAEEATSQPITLLMPETFREAHRKGMARYLSTGEAHVIGKTVELVGRRKDGTEFPLELSLTAWKSSGSTFFTAILRDITERKRAEAQLKAAKEAAEAASQAKSTFLATMSHEIRTPMNGILGMTDLVLDTELTPEQRDNLGLVKLSAESLLSIINDILDFSKIEAGKLDMESIPFDLRESLGETMKALGLRAHQKGLELVYDVQPDVPEALAGDPGRIRQILINLVGNAIKFTERGEILVNVEEESQEQDTTCLHVSVKDTGVGIPADKQEQIFEAFSQADSSMARKFGGTGLGLTISALLVEMMGGRIWVESQVGQGSTFHFTLRLAVQKTPAARPAPLQPEQLHELPVLVVDDNFTNRRVLGGMLARWGMRPTAVEGGRPALQALELAKNLGHSFPLVLLDGQMPEMDGFALAEQIQKNPELAGATIMMLTSAGHMGDAARCRELGISAYLVKPIRQAELLDAICLVLQKSPQKIAVPLVTRHTLREERKRLRILLAEDNAVNQTLAVRLLEKRGYTVTVAGNGRAALEALEKEKFDLVLMDIQMPEMDGLQATAAIREKEKSTSEHIPIIAMTAHAMKGDQEQFLAAGMDRYISKPIRTSELFATIENLVNVDRGHREIETHRHAEDAQSETAAVPLAPQERK